MTEAERELAKGMSSSSQLANRMNVSSEWFPRSHQRGACQVTIGHDNEPHLHVLIWLTYLVSLSIFSLSDRSTRSLSTRSIDDIRLYDRVNTALYMR